MITKYVAIIHQDWKEEYFLVYAHKVISTAFDLVICWRKPFKVDFVDLLKCEFMPAILFCLDYASLTPKGVNNAQLFQDS